MSRKRVVYGQDAKGRPLSRWEDPPAEPAFGHMQPAFETSAIERRQATKAELADREEQRQEHEAAIATEAGIVVLRSLPDNPRAHPWRLPVRAEEEPVVIETVSEPVIEDQVDAGPAQSGSVPADDLPASTATREIRPLHELADAAERAAAAWDRLQEHDRLRVTLVADWTRSREALAEWWEESDTILGARQSVTTIRTWPATFKTEPQKDPDAYYAPVPPEVVAVDPEQVAAEVEAAWAERQAVEAPTPEAGGGPGLLTVHEQRVLASTVKHNGDRKAVATELGFNHVESVDGALEKVGKKGALPIALIPLLPARFAKYPGV